MGTTVSPASIEEAPPPKSFVERFVGVFISPRTTFADIARKPDFVAPLIVVIVLTMAVTATMLGKFGMERIVRKGIERSRYGSSLRHEQIERRVRQGAKRGAKLGVITTFLAGFVGVPIVVLIFAGIGQSITNAIFGVPLNFKTAISLTCYANLVSVLGLLMSMVMILLGDPKTFYAQSHSPADLGFWLKPLETSKPLMTLASSLNIFNLWMMGLLGIGFSEATGRKVKALSIFLAFLGLWATWVLGKAAWAAMF